MCDFLQIHSWCNMNTNNFSFLEHTKISDLKISILKQQNHIQCMSKVLIGALTDLGCIHSLIFVLNYFMDDVPDDSK